MGGVLSSEAFNRQVVAAVEDYLRRLQFTPPTAVAHRAGRMLWEFAISNVDIPPATDATREPSFGEVEILQADVTGALVRTGVKEIGVNRWEHIEILKDTGLLVAGLDQEHLIAGADCGPMANPPL